MEKQVCSRCTKELPLTNEFFKKTKLLSTGFYKTCKKCCAEYQPGYGRNAQMKSRYGLTPEQYDERLQAQGGVCELCGMAPGKQQRRFSVDHNHKCCPSQKSCGECLRGILCANCNRRVGFLEQMMEEALVTPFPTVIGTKESWTGRAMHYLKKYARLTQETQK